MQRILQATPASREVQSARTFKNIGPSQSTYTKSKEIVITVGGDYRIRFTLMDFGSQTTYAQVNRTRDGVTTAVGIERILTNASVFVEYVEDIGGWEPGDLCQLYCKHAGANAGQVGGFIISAEYAWVPSPIPAGEVLTDTAV